MVSGFALTSYLKSSPWSQRSGNGKYFLTFNSWFNWKTNRQIMQKIMKNDHLQTQTRCQPQVQYVRKWIGKPGQPIPSQFGQLNWQSTGKPVMLYLCCRMMVLFFQNMDSLNIWNTTNTGDNLNSSTVRDFGTSFYGALGQRTMSQIQDTSHQFNNLLYTINIITFI